MDIFNKYLTYSSYHLENTLKSLQNDFVTVFYRLNLVKFMKYLIKCTKTTSNAYYRHFSLSKKFGCTANQNIVSQVLS